MTLDKLARMVQKGLEAIATKAEMNERFKQVEESFQDIDNKFRGIDNKIDALYFEIKDIKSSIPPLITTIGHLEGEILSFC